MNKSLLQNRWLLVLSLILFLPIAHAVLNALPPSLFLLAVLSAVGFSFWWSLKRSTSAEQETRSPSPLHGRSGREEFPLTAPAAGAAGSSEPGSNLPPFLRDLWNSKRHGLVMLCAAIWLLCPLDFDWVPILGWCDDGFAIALGCKHFFDLFRRDVNTAHAAMRGQLPHSAAASPIHIIDAERVVVRDANPLCS